MKNRIKCLLILLIILWVSGSAHALPIARFGALLSNNAMDQWMLELLYDSDLSVTLTNPSSSYTFFGTNSGPQHLSGGNTYNFSGLSSGSYYAVNTGYSSSTGGEGDDFVPGPFPDMTDIETPVYETEGLSLQITPVPEPATMLIFGAGLIFLAGTLRKFNN